MSDERETDSDTVFQYTKALLMGGLHNIRYIPRRFRIITFKIIPLKPLTEAQITSRGATICSIYLSMETNSHRITAGADLR